MVPPCALSLISRLYVDGKILTDTRILGSQEVKIGEQEFEAPEGYARREPGLEMAIPE